MLTHTSGPGFSPWVWKIPWRRAWLPNPVFFPGESRGQRSPMDSTRWSRRESDMTEQLTSSLSIHTNVICILFLLVVGVKPLSCVWGCLTKLEEYLSAVPRSLYSLSGGMWFCYAEPSNRPPLTPPQLEEKLCFALQDKGKVQAH